MKYSLKPKELQDVENFISHSPMAKLLREFQNWKFEIGDVLVKFKTNYAGVREIDIVSEVCPVPKKYIVVFLDELNVPWVKQISVRGGLGNKLYCILNYSQPNVSWEVDPEQVDALLLGYRYDPRAEYKQMRTENPTYGGKKADKE